MAVFDANGKVTSQLKFATPKEYPAFLEALTQTFEKLETNGITEIIAAVPGRLDRENGKVLGYGTLPWPPATIRSDLQKALNNLPVTIENDAKLAGLSEGIIIINEFKKVLYITISTGISNALIVNGVIDPSLRDSEGGQVLIEENGQLKQWEDVASGRAIVAKYGKRASELDDPKAWEEIASNIAIGVIDLLAILQPEVVVFGGGVGAHFKKFEKPLTATLHKLASSVMTVPPLRVARRAEEAVIYGCYELAKQAHGTSS